MKKKKLDEKAEKKKIAKEIHRLKASLKACEEIKKDKNSKNDEDSDSDNEKMDWKKLFIDGFN